MNVRDQVPTYNDYIIPTIQALRDLGGSGNTREIFSKIVELMNLPDEIVAVPRKEGGTYSLAAYRTGWARYHLKLAGYIKNIQRGLWTLTEKGRKSEDLDPKAVVEEAHRLSRKQPPKNGDPEGDDIEDGGDGGTTWQDETLAFLRQVPPATFERLAGLLLRKSGFVSVEVTGQSGDGGIDGTGVLRLGGMLGFKMMFQCKRYSGSVSPREIREFQAAMLGRADKGLFITTGRFTKAAMEEAARDGAPAIDLVDGEDLCELLKKHRLGVNVIMVEKVVLDQEWFNQV